MMPSDPESHQTLDHLYIVKKRSNTLQPGDSPFPGRRLTANIVRSSSGFECKHHEQDSGQPPRKRIKVSSKQRPRSKSPKIEPETGSLLYRLFKLIVSLVLYSLGLCIFFSLLIVAISFSLQWMQSRCDFLHNLNFDVAKIKEKLEENIVGQPHAVSQLVSVLEKFHTQHITEPQVVWCVGWTGVGKSKALSVVKSLIIDQASVQYLLPSLVPNEGDAFDSFVKEVVAGMNSCMKNIIIIDGWDETADTKVTQLASAIKSSVGAMAVENTKLQQLLIVIAGVRGGKALNRHYLSERLLDKPRNDLDLSQFTDVMTKTDEYDIITTLGSLTIVPFLPLEAEHIRECVKKEISHVRELVNAGIIVLDDENAASSLSEDFMSKKVIEYLPFLPNENPILSSTGCKRVFSVLRQVLGDIEFKQST